MCLGMGFWALTGGLDGRLESEMRSYYANKSLMDLYSDELSNVKSDRPILSDGFCVL